MKTCQGTRKMVSLCPLFSQRNELSKETQFPNFWHCTALGYPLEAFSAPQQSLTWTESGGIMANIWAGVGWDGEIVGGQWQPQPVIHLTGTVLPFTDFTLRGFPTCRLLPYSDRKVNSLTSMAQSMVKTAPSRRRAWPQRQHEVSPRIHLKSPVPETDEPKRIIFI